MPKTGAFQNNILASKDRFRLIPCPPDTPKKKSMGDFHSREGVGSGHYD